MTQTGGCCRASNYIAFIRRALKKAGLDIPDGILTREELVNALVALKNR